MVEMLLDYGFVEIKGLDCDIALLHSFLVRVDLVLG